MIRTTACFEAHCDECDIGFGGHEDGDATIHYADSEKLEHELTANDWTITGTRTVCPACQRHLACTLVGHDWQAWQSLAHLRLPGSMRSCTYCGAAEFDPPAHPRTPTPTDRYTPIAEPGNRP